MLKVTLFNSIMGNFLQWRMLLIWVFYFPSSLNQAGKALGGHCGPIYSCAIVNSKCDWRYSYSPTCKCLTGYQNSDNDTACVRNKGTVKECREDWSNCLASDNKECRWASLTHNGKTEWLNLCLCKSWYYKWGDTEKCEKGPSKGAVVGIVTGCIACVTLICAVIVAVVYKTYFRNKGNQVNGAAFNRFAVNPTCKLCSARPETRQHFIAECVVFKDYRQDYIKKLADSGILSDSCIRQLRDPEFLTQLTLDCSVCVDLKTLDSRKLGLLEQYSREYIHTLHIKRFVTLRQISEN